MASDLIYNHRKEFDTNTARSAELLLNQIDRFELLLNDLLEVSRFDAQAATLQLSNFDLISLIRKSIDYTNLNSQKIELISPDSLSINADARRIERIMRNLLSNAIDHSEDKPIMITVAANESDVSVAVRDLGIGFNENQSLRLFDRFWRADPSRTRSRGGTGLGLSIALEDAKLHGGQLQAWGKPNQGANFVLTLPKVYGAQIGQPPLSVIPKDLVTK
jgi:two-component system sensor histidine kinase MtrB